MSDKPKKKGRSVHQRVISLDAKQNLDAGVLARRRILSKVCGRAISAHVRQMELGSHKDFFAFYPTGQPENPSYHVLTSTDVDHPPVPERPLQRQDWVWMWEYVASVLSTWKPEDEGEVHSWSEETDLVNPTTDEYPPTLPPFENPPTPHFDKIDQSEKHVLDNFLDWLDDIGLHLCTHTGGCPDMPYTPIGPRDRGWLTVRYYGADPKEVQKEQKLCLTAMQNWHEALNENTKTNS